MQGTESGCKRPRLLDKSCGGSMLHQEQEDIVVVSCKLKISNYKSYRRSFEFTALRDNMNTFLKFQNA